MNAPMITATELAAEINAALGEGTVRMGNDPSLQVKFWPTGILPIDYLLNGGLPTGRFVECYGDYSTLKSFIALRALANVQKLGGKVALVDTEHAYDPEWAERLGVDVLNLPVQQPDTAEEGIALIELLVRSDWDLVVWDSIAASQPKQYHASKPGEDLAPAGLARVMSNGLRRLTSANKKTAILALNQTRVNVGMTYGGSHESVPGGKSMPFYASYRMKLTKAGRLSEEVKVHDGDKLVAGKRVYAHKIKASLEKSKLSKPFTETWFLYDLANGDIDVPAFLLSQGIERGLIHESNARYSIPGVVEQSIHGKPKFKQFLIDNPEVIEWMTTEIMGEVSVACPGAIEPPKSKAAGKKRKS